MYQPRRASSAHLHTLLPHALCALKGPAAESEDVARFDAPEGDSQRLVHQDSRTLEVWLAPHACSSVEVRI